MIRPICGDCKTLCHIAKGSSKMFCCPCRAMLKSGVVLTEDKESESHLSSTAPTQVFPAVDDNIHHAVVALKKNLVIAVPTDTLYGLAGDACSEQAVKKIYRIKGRTTMNPLAVCLAHPEDFKKYSVTSHLPDGLLQELFPGPVTAVLLRGDHSLLNECLNPGLCSIGIRIPDSIFIRRVAEAFGGALALTSANISGQPSTIRVQEFESLWPHCASIFDAGELPAAREGSTIVELTVPGSFKVLRPGSALEATLATLEKHGLREASST